MIETESSSEPLTVSRDRIDHRVPAIARLEIKTGSAVRGRLLRLLGAIVEASSALMNSARCFRRKISPKLCSPQGGWLLSSLKFSCSAIATKGVLVGRVQPAAADVEEDIGRGQNGVGAAATRSRASSTMAESRIFQRMRGAEARGARADDGDIDWRRGGT